MKVNFKVVDNFVSDKHVGSIFKFEYKPEKAQSQITNKIVYDSETFNIDKVVPFANCIYNLGKNSGNYIRDISDRELEICKKDCIVFKGTESINEMLDHDLQFKEKLKRLIIKMLPVI